tara:strand:+ start:2104 stop:2778 length:675 start_codon:yes stop_codon:yes gene_type:complete
MNIVEAIEKRKSVRGFLDQEIPREVIDKILQISSRAPSGSNTQPWKVYVISGEFKRNFSDNFIQYRIDYPKDETPQYQYYPTKWREPYLGRRRATGWGLYGILGIQKGDREGAFKQQLKNYNFFGAPVGIFFTIDSDMEIGSWLDIGMFIQNVMLASRNFGLETCPQAAWVYHHQKVRELLPIPENETLVCGMAIGYENKEEVANQFITGRESTSVFAKFFGYE